MRLSRRWFVQAAAPALAADWPQFLGPARNGTSPETGLKTQWPASGPPLVWKRDAGQGFSGPVAAQGRLILFHRVQNRETVECLDARTGKGLWKFEAPTQYRDDFGFDEGPRAAPSVAGGRVYTFGAEGMMHCLDVSTGKSVWAVDTQKTFGFRKGYFGAAGSPLVDGDRVLANIGGANGAGIVALDARTGKTLWTATGDEASYSSPVMATIDGARHALFFTRAGLTDLDPANGRVRFQFPWRSRSQASVNAAAPVVAGNLVFISACYGTGAALVEIGDSAPRKVWASDDVMSNHYATCVLRDGFLYGFHGRQEEGQELRCVELKTAAVRWKVDRFRAGTVTLAGDRLLVLSEEGELLNAPASPDGFRPSAQAKILKPVVRAFPALSEGLLYARNESMLACVSLH